MITNHNGSAVKAVIEKVDCQEIGRSAVWVRQNEIVVVNLWTATFCH
jgi:hypothetical protein